MSAQLSSISDWLASICSIWTGSCGNSDYPGVLGPLVAVDVFADDVVEVADTDHVSALELRGLRSDGGTS